MCLFFFQAEDGIRDLVRSRGLGDVYKRQPYYRTFTLHQTPAQLSFQRTMNYVINVLGSKRMLYRWPKWLLHLRWDDIDPSPSGSNVFINSSRCATPKSFANVGRRQSPQKKRAKYVLHLRVWHLAPQISHSLTLLTLLHHLTLSLWPLAPWAKTWFPSQELNCHGFQAVRLMASIMRLASALSLIHISEPTRPY